MSDTAILNATLGSLEGQLSESRRGAFKPLQIPAISGQFLDAIVSYVESWTLLYVQLPSAPSVLAELQSSLSSYYYSTNEHIFNPLPGATAITRIGLNSGLFRVIVIKREDPILVKVFFVDYGNTEDVDIGALRSMPPRLFEVPAQAIGIRISAAHLAQVGTITLVEYRELLQNARVSIKMGQCVTGGYFCGTIYVYDSNGRYHLLDEAITQRIQLNRLQLEWHSTTSRATIIHKYQAVHLPLAERSEEDSEQYVIIPGLASRNAYEPRGYKEERVPPKLNVAAMNAFPEPSGRKSEKQIHRMIQKGRDYKSSLNNLTKGREVPYMHDIGLRNNSLMSFSRATLSDSRPSSNEEFPMQGPIFWMLMWVAVPVILFLVATPIFFLYKYSKKRKSKQKVSAAGVIQSEHRPAVDEQAAPHMELPDMHRGSYTLEAQSAENAFGKMDITEEDLASFAGLIVAERLRRHKEGSKRQRRGQSSGSRTSSGSITDIMQKSSSKSRSHSSSVRPHQRRPAGFSPTFDAVTKDVFLGQLKKPGRLGNPSPNNSCSIREIKLCNGKVTFSDKDDSSSESDCTLRRASSCSSTPSSSSTVTGIKLHAKGIAETSENNSSMIPGRTYSSSFSSSPSASGLATTEVESTLKHKYARPFCSDLEKAINTSVSAENETEGLGNGASSKENGFSNKATLCLKKNNNYKLSADAKHVDFTKQHYVAIEIEHSEEELLDKNSFNCHSQRASGKNSRAEMRSIDNINHSNSWIREPVIQRSTAGNETDETRHLRGPPLSSGDDLWPMTSDRSSSSVQNLSTPKNTSLLSNSLVSSNDAPLRIEYADSLHESDFEMPQLSIIDRTIAGDGVTRSGVFEANSANPEVQPAKRASRCDVQRPPNQTSMINNERHVNEFQPSCASVRLAKILSKRSLTSTDSMSESPSLLHDGWAPRNGDSESHSTSAASTKSNETSPSEAFSRVKSCRKCSPKGAYWESRSEISMRSPSSTSESSTTDESLSTTSST